MAEKTTLETLRSRFEEWAAESYGGEASHFFMRCDPPHNDEYKAADVQAAWRSWEYSATEMVRAIAEELDEFARHLMTEADQHALETRVTKLRRDYGIEG